ncbi:MAG TPA: kelch repeat-containing protein [Actinomycetota bacterium]|jgi:N-acetylneuraminic acid mutarotase
MGLPARFGLVPALALLVVACTNGGGAPSSPAPTVDGVAWSALAEMPTPRSEVAAASDGERLVVAGGFDATGASVTTVEILDLSTGTWSAGPDLPVAVNHAMASAFDGTVAVAGGYGGPGLSGPTDRVFALRGDTWQELPPMPGPRGAAGAATVDDGLVVAGGVGPDGLADEMYLLDPEVGRWITVQGPPTGREHLGVAGLGGDVYVVGGRTGGIGSNLAASEAYDVEAGTWRELPPMPTARGGSAAAATSNGFVVSAGGEEEGGTFAEAEAFDVAEGRWVSLPPMPTARHGLGVVAVGTVVYTIAGGEEPGLSVTGTVESIDLAPLAP